MWAGYRRARFLSFLHPWADPQNTGYQIVQSLMALGSGHWVGVGLGASRQKWMYVPNAHTDFIFSILGEETGLIGEIVVIGLFVVLVYAGIRIAVRAPDTFGRLLAAGITGWIAFQAVVNMGRSPACCRSRACRFPSCRTGARRSWSRWPRSACCSRSAGRLRSARRGPAARAAARAGGRAAEGG